MKEHYDKETEEYEKQKSKSSNNKSVSRPNIAPKPTYTAKAPKK